jgi:glutamine synthetase
MNIAIKSLTTCSATRDGELVELRFVDAAGCSRSLEMTFSDAQSIAMTLPRLLAGALQRLTGSDQARYVFALGTWTVEPARNTESIIATLATEDGFQVSFAVPREACRGLAWALRREADSPTQSDDADALADTLADIATGVRAN